MNDIETSMFFGNHQLLNLSTYNISHQPTSASFKPKFHLACRVTSRRSQHVNYPTHFLTGKSRDVTGLFTAYSNKM